MLKSKQFFRKSAPMRQEAGLSRVLGAKTGVVKNLGCLYRNPGEPSLHVVSSAITAFHRYSGNKADFAATGTSLGREQALWSATGESVERSCAALSDFQALVRASYDELVACGHKVLHPTEFTLFTREQYQLEGFPFVRPDTKQRLSWICGERLNGGEPVMVPAALVFNQFRPQKGEIRLCPDIHPGVASGFSKKRVLRGALLEIAERDSMMIHWLNRLPVCGIVMDEEYEAVRRDCGIPAGLELHLAFLENDLDLTCIFALLLDESRGLMGGGCSAGFYGRAVARKAVCEAVQILLLSREVQRGDKGRLAQRTSVFPPDFLSPEGRRKLPLTELIFNLAYYLEPENWGALRALRSPRRRVRLDDCDRAVAKGQEYEALVEKFMKAGMPPICVDLTTSDVAELGWLVYRVIAPGSVPNTATLFPPAALPRLCSAPDRLGFEAAKTLNPEPMPYA